MTYYQLLDINRNSSTEEIKKAYKRLAVLCHPDKNEGNDEKFKELNEAYTVLSDQLKKIEYDKKLAFSNTFNRWSSAFGKSNTAGNFHKEKKAEVRGENISKYVEFTLDKLNQHTIIHRVVKCALCDGTGAKTLKQCNKCNGKGIYRLPPHDGIDRIIDCEICNTRGKCIDEICDACKGLGGIMSTESIEINIPDTAITGDVLTYNGKGNAGMNGASCGDLIITLVKKEINEYKEDEVFDISKDEYDQLQK